MKKTIYLLALLLLTALSACSDEDNGSRVQSELMYGWRMTAMQTDGESVDVSATPIPELLYFGEQSVCYMATPVCSDGEWTYRDRRTAWSVTPDGDILNIAAMLPVSVYFDEVNAGKLKIHYFEYTATGHLSRIDKDFIRENVEIIDLKIRVKE